MDQYFIQEMKKKLDLERKELRKRLDGFGNEDAHVKDDFHSKFPDYGNKEEDNATEVAEYQDNLALEGSLEKRLIQVDKALERVDKGKYGICENCQKEIAKERLQVNPAATICMDCQE